MCKSGYPLLIWSICYEHCYFHIYMKTLHIYQLPLLCCLYCIHVMLFHLHLLSIAFHQIVLYSILEHSLFCIHCCCSAIVCILCSSIFSVKCSFKSDVWVCHGQVSYGEMIGCDNEQCSIEWFHFDCVRLTHKPKGKWFCPRCRGSRPNIMNPDLLAEQQKRSDRSSTMKRYAD